MSLLNPAYAIILPFLFICTLPFAITANITTIIALSILLIRVALVYIELALAIIPHYLFGSLTPKELQAANANPPIPSPTGARRKKRRGSSSSNFSGTGTITPISGEALSSLSQSFGSPRDYEGLGGWKLVDNPSDDEELWSNINSRLELPAEHTRRHRRSLTSGSMPSESRASMGYSPEAVMNTSRARTPPSSVVGLGGEYFAMGAGSRSSGLKRNSSGVEGLGQSSGSLKGGSGLVMKPR